MRRFRPERTARFNEEETALAIATRINAEAIRNMLIDGPHVDLSVVIVGDSLYRGPRHIPVTIHFDPRLSTIRRPAVRALLRHLPNLLHERNNAGETPFFSALQGRSSLPVCEERKEVWAVFLNQALDYDSTTYQGRTLVMESTLSRDMELFLTILARTEKSHMFLADSGGNTPLSNAATGAHVEILRYLLDHDADLNHQAHIGESPLLLAIKNKCSAAVRVLLADDRVNINAQRSDGMTALMMAAERDDREPAKLLLNRKNIDLDLRDNFSWTALIVGPVAI
ncbi:hypothetical protein ETB97_011197 [Aspergillus alliaceus]|uniref:Uncharacterized protein n=1 Tax=Petromyces alliaceus TaxID=209559 RepID=A0A8H6A6T5_PETAA|nr:hypothetical protein ETB97_011197 [Aspergillus burnettii]